MICPRCKKHTFTLLFTINGPRCRDCASRMAHIPQPPVNPSVQELFSRLTLKEWLLLPFVLGWAVFSTLIAGFFVLTWRWVTVRRECKWCNPPHYMGGNPLARRRTHGMCKKAMDRSVCELAGLSAHGEAAGPLSSKGRVGASIHSGAPGGFGNSVGHYSSNHQPQRRHS